MSGVNEVNEQPASPDIVLHAESVDLLPVDESTGGGGGDEEVIVECSGNRKNDHVNHVEEDTGKGKEEAASTIDTISSSSFTRFSANKSSKGLLLEARNSYNYLIPRYWTGMGPSGMPCYQAYVGGLTWQISEKSVYDALYEIGMNDVLDVKMIRNENDGTSKGYCIVCFQSMASIGTLLGKLTKIKICGRFPRIKPPTKMSKEYFEEVYTKFRSQKGTRWDKYGEDNKNLMDPEGTSIGPISQRTSIGPISRGTSIGPISQRTSIGPISRGPMGMAAGGFGPRMVGPIRGPNHWNTGIVRNPWNSGIGPVPTNMIPPNYQGLSSPFGNNCPQNVLGVVPPNAYYGQEQAFQPRNMVSQKPSMEGLFIQGGPRMGPQGIPTVMGSIMPSPEMHPGGPPPPVEWNYRPPPLNSYAASHVQDPPPQGTVMQRPSAFVPFREESRNGLHPLGFPLMTSPQQTRAPRPLMNPKFYNQQSRPHVGPPGSYGYVAANPARIGTQMQHIGNPFHLQPSGSFSSVLRDHQVQNAPPNEPVPLEMNAIARKEIMAKNEHISSLAIKIAVNEAHAGKPKSGIDTLSKAISLIRRTEEVNYEACQILINGLQITMSGMKKPDSLNINEGRSRYCERECYSRRKKRERSRSRERNCRDRTRSRDRYFEYPKERSRSRERDDRNRETEERKPGSRSNVRYYNGDRKRERFERDIHRERDHRIEQKRFERQTQKSGEQSQSIEQNDRREI